MTFFKTLFFTTALALSTFCSFGQKSTTEPNSKLLDVYIPNAFTPDMNGVNDVFKPIINGPEIEFYELLIVDRSGKTVFTSKEPTEVWNGTTPGTNYVTSTNLFIYFLKVKSAESLEYQVFKGHVAMIR